MYAVGFAELIGRVVEQMHWAADAELPVSMPGRTVGWE